MSLILRIDPNECVEDDQKCQKGEQFSSFMCNRPSSWDISKIAGEIESEKVSV